MGDINMLSEIDFSSILIGLFIILFGLKAIISIFEWFCVKLGIETKWNRQKREEHELLMSAITAIKEIQDTHCKDKKEVIDKNNTLEKILSDFMVEVRNEIKQFTNNRISDREQSLEIQKELSNSIKAVVEIQTERDDKIDALICGSKELLGSTIDQLYSRYLALDGVPENEVDELDDIFQAYKRLNGNHRRDLKYDYIKNHLDVIPVETKLVIKND